MRTPTPDEMHGVWRLESVRTALPDGGEELPFGAHPNGTIIYLRDGAMAVHIAGSDEAAGLLRAYGGRWHLADDCVVHDVEVSFEHDLLGVRLERHADFDPHTGVLLYTTIEAQGPGHPVVQWRKAR